MVALTATAPGIMSSASFSMFVPSQSQRIPSTVMVRPGLLRHDGLTYSARPPGTATCSPVARFVAIARLRMYSPTSVAGLPMCRTVKSRRLPSWTIASESTVNLLGMNGLIIEPLLSTPLPMLVTVENGPALIWVATPPQLPMLLAMYVGSVE